MTNCFTSRPLSPYEISECRKAFGDKLHYQAVKIFEGCTLPNLLDDFGNLFKKIPPRDVKAKNAITLGNRCLFGRVINTSKANDMSWVIHELTHVWQYQTMGWHYLFKAMAAHKRLGVHVYDFGGEEGLKKHIQKAGKFTDFNMEQQGDIVKGYYEKLCKGEDTSAWGYFIEQMEKASPG